MKLQIKGDPTRPLIRTFMRDGRREGQQDFAVTYTWVREGFNPFTGELDPDNDETGTHEMHVPAVDESHAQAFLDGYFTQDVEMGLKITNVSAVTRVEVEWVE